MRKIMTILLVGILAFLYAGTLKGAAPEVVSLSPDNPYNDSIQICIVFNQPVSIKEEAVIDIYTHSEGESSELKHATGKLVLSPDDVLGKTVTALFTLYGSDSYKYHWSDGYIYRFVIEKGMIGAIASPAERNQKIEWSVDNRLSAPTFSHQAQVLDRINVNDIVIEWQGEENAVEISGDKTPMLEIQGEIPNEGAYWNWPAGSRTYPLIPEIDEDNHIYRFRATSENSGNPATLNLMQDVIYTMNLHNINSKRIPHRKAEFCTPSYLIGNTDSEDDCFLKVEPVATSMSLNSFNYIWNMYVDFNMPLEEFDVHSACSYYVNGIFKGKDHFSECTSDNPYKVHVMLYGPTYQPENVYEIEFNPGLIRPVGEQMSFMPTRRITIDHNFAGMPIIDEDAEATPTYDIYGRRVEQPVPGSIYIRNGKKFIMP